MTVSDLNASRARLLAVIVFVLVTSLALVACTIGGGSSDRQAADGKNAEEVIKPIFSFTDGDSGVSVLDPIAVHVNEDELSDVTMTNEQGGEVKGEMGEDKKSWSSVEPLGYGRTYTVAATVDGETTEQSFTTINPNIQVNTNIKPNDGAVVGVGQTIAIRFGVAIEDRRAAQEAITVTTDPPVEGAFFWLSDWEVRWRPAEFWQPGTKVTVDAKVYGKDFGNNNYGASDINTRFTIGDRVVATADDATKTMTVTRNDVVEQTMPISMGRGEYLTPNGVYILGDHNESMVMDSTTYGLAIEDGGYRTDVKYATQMSYSGIYVHAAPWSVWAQGSQNTSHGCLNVSTENAKWFYENTKRGDIVIVKNTKGEVLSGYDGLGDWNIPWETWKAGNATPDTKDSE